MKDKHQKHPPLKRPNLGQYHRLEWAIYGTTCGEIESFYLSVNEYFKGKFRLSYIDADHSDESKDSALQIGKKTYTQIHVFPANKFDDKFNTGLSQAIFINGNHYPGSRQIIIINPDKRDSLHRRVEQLDQIDIVIIPDEQTEIYDFVKMKMTKDSLVFQKNEMSKVFDCLESEIKRHIPPIKALILAGGKSSRMHEDKSQLKYYGDITQEEYLGKMCAELEIETYISKSYTEPQSEIHGFEVIKDRYVDMGPAGAILSAFLKDPDAAWLVLACDLPYISTENIKKLIDQRSVLHYASAFKLEENPFPEPLIAIYEPAIYKRMLEFLSLGYACPRKVLINSEVKHILLEDEKVAFNANTPIEKEAVLSNLKNKV
jgi:molybdopterin-guanine dinucleotide biosynthesis protein A